MLASELPPFFRPFKVLFVQSKQRSGKNGEKSAFTCGSTCACGHRKACEPDDTNARRPDERGPQQQQRARTESLNAHNQPTSRRQGGEEQSDFCDLDELTSASVCAGFMKKDAATRKKHWITHEWSNCWRSSSDQTCQIREANSVNCSDWTYETT